MPAVQVTTKTLPDGTFKIPTGHEGTLGWDLVKVGNLTETARSPVQDRRRQPTHLKRSKPLASVSALRRQVTVGRYQMRRHAATRASWTVPRHSPHSAARA
jgi:hypothetical protein